LTAEQLEASRAERMRQNGHGALTLEDARTWIEETGLCLFLPRRQYSSSIAPSFVEAVAGHQNATPDQKYIQLAEELLVRLELDDVAVRLNLLGQPGEQPDFVVASWVLPYVYALRGDRDWRRSPQLTGSRQVSQLAVQAYKLLEAGDTNIADLKHALGREVTETAVVRAITELWQQLRIIPVISAPGVPAKWQLLRHRFQKAIAEGASTSQVTAISVLASIYLQAVIAASMEEVELFLAPLTARSKVREVLRGLVATRQVHTISLGHAPHFYVAGTLPEFAVPTTVYASSSMPASAYFLNSMDHEDEIPEVRPYTPNAPEPIQASAEPEVASEIHAPRAFVRKPVSNGKPSTSRPHFSRPAAGHARDRKGPQSSASKRPVRRTASEGRPTTGGHLANGSRPANGSRTAGGTRWSANSSANGNGNGSVNGNGKATHTENGNGRHAANGNGHGPSNGNGAGKISRPAGNGARPESRVTRPANGTGGRTAQASKPTWNPRGARPSATKAGGKPTSNGSAPRNGSVSRNGSAARPDARTARGSRKPALAAGAKAGNSKRYGFTARPKQENRQEKKKRG